MTTEPSFLKTYHRILFQDTFHEVYPFMIFTGVTHPYERTVTKLRLEKSIHQNMPFYYIQYGTTLTSAFIFKLTFLHKSKI